MEYRDPDYGAPPSSERSLDAARASLSAEIQREIETKEQTLERVVEGLFGARKLFQHLKYSIINRFYNNEGFSTDDTHREVYIQRDPEAKAKILDVLSEEQNRLHPAVKALLNNPTEPSESILHIARPVRKRLKSDIKPPIDSANCQESELEIRDVQMEISDVKQENDASSASLKVPMHVEPKNSDTGVLQIGTTARNAQRKKFRIIIGNTSKYIKPSFADELVTHRWLLYIRGPKSNPDISHIVESITVKLHESYAPQNVIKLKSAPFHLSKRGWGEFPVVLKFHFKNEILNKPVNIIHQLKLDRYHTGLQTLCGETVADVWLYTDESSNEYSDQKFHEEQKNENSLDFKGEVCLENIKEEPMDVDDYYDEFSDFYYKEEIDDNQIFVKKLHSYVIEEHSYARLKSINHNGNLEESIMTHLQSLVCFNDFTLWYKEIGLRTDVNFDVEKFVEYNRLLFDKLTDMSNSRQKSIKDNVIICNKYLLAVYVEKLNSIFSPDFSSECCDMMKCVNILKNILYMNCDIDYKISDTIMIGRKIVQIVNNFHKSYSKSNDLRVAVNVIFKRIPMVECDNNVDDILEYQMCFPFVVESLDKYFSLDVYKRRNLVWTRAKFIHNFLQNYFQADVTDVRIWSTKQILIFGQYHGYYPARPTDLVEESNVTIREDKIRLKELFKDVAQINTKTHIDVFDFKLDQTNCFANDEENNIDNLEDKLFCISDSSDDEIDISNDIEGKRDLQIPKSVQSDKVSRCEILDFASKDEELQCRYIDRVSNQLGFELQAQNVGNGYSASLIHRVILSVLKSFINDLVRRAFCVKMEALNGNIAYKLKFPDSSQENFLKPSMKREIKSESETESYDDSEVSSAKSENLISKIWHFSENSLNSEIHLRHIFEALKTRTEFDIFTNHGLGIEKSFYKEKL